MGDLELFLVENKANNDVMMSMEEALAHGLNNVLPGDMEGETIGITVGSRGIKELNDVLSVVISELNKRKAKVVLISAMGSHGGGTREGQQGVLDSLGITESALGVPILISECWQEISPKVFLAEDALKLDGIIVMNRVKPHTSFNGEIESGLSKMLVVGLGGPLGASAFHNRHPSLLSKDLEERAKTILSKVNVIAGIGIIENGDNRIAHLEVHPKENIIDGDKALLRRSRDFLAKIPVDEADILIIEEMGKNFSGTGMDTKVIGRFRIPEVMDPEKPNFRRIIVKDISAKSKGNASGIGLADFVLRDLLEKVDWQVTYKNVIASTFLMKAMIPIVATNGSEALQMALESLSLTLSDARIVVIKNTLNLDTVLITENLISKLDTKVSVKEKMKYLL